MLKGSPGIFGPTLGFSILKLSKTATKQLMLIISATLGLHSGVGGTAAAAASKIDDIRLLSPIEKFGVDHTNYKIAREKLTFCIRKNLENFYAD